MDSTLFKKLEICNAEQSWEYCRDIVAVQLMGDQVFPVPFPRDAASYDTCHVILKSRRTTIEKLTGGMSSAVVVGHLSNFVTGANKTCLTERLAAVHKDRDSNLNQVYEFHEDDMKFGVRKSITVQLWGCEKYTMECQPQSREFNVDLLSHGFVNIDRIFLVTEVYYVTELKIHLVIGKEEDDFVIKGKIPIAFSLCRYKVCSDGTLQNPKPIPAPKWKVKWVRKLTRDKNDPLPLDPNRTSILRRNDKEDSESLL